MTAPFCDPARTIRPLSVHHRVSNSPGTWSIPAVTGQEQVPKTRLIAALIC